MRQVWISRHGGPHVLRMREVPEHAPTPDELTIDVRAAGVNFADIMMRVGLYPGAPALPFPLGIELSGVVTAVGEGAAVRRLGEHVIAYPSHGGYAERLCVPEHRTYPMPSGMTFEEGAAFGVAYGTAYRLLRVATSVRPESTILVHSAGGGVGLAILDLARIFGARVFAVASRRKHAVVLERGAVAVFESGERNIQGKVRAATGGRGVDVAFDPVGGTSWRDSFRCLAPSGMLVVYGMSRAASYGPLARLHALGTLASTLGMWNHPLTLMETNRGIVGVNLARVLEAGESFDEAVRALTVWYDQGLLKPLVDSVFPLEEAAAAHVRLQRRLNVGNVVLAP